MVEMSSTESLTEEAARVWEESRRTCAPSGHRADSCRWHHGLWPWLRALGLATSPAHFAPFYGAALREALGDRSRPRLLVSGAADAEMVKLAADACGPAQRLAVCAVDLCETPLASSRRFAAARGLALSTFRGDILAFESAERFDAICTDSFLGQFAPDARPRLVAHWAKLLAPGGAVLTVNRLRPDRDPSQRVGFAPDEARTFCAAVRSAAAALPARLRPEASELARETEAYTLRQSAWPVRSAEEVRALFERAGFAYVKVEVAPMPGAAPAATAPTLAGGAPYARVVARLA
jgi:SAM-dependent methyltransferase